MKAAVLREVGGSLQIEDVSLGPLREGQVRVRLAASGVCRTDASIIDGSIPHELPAVLGHEGAGIISELGPGVTSLSVGQHVICSWIAPCRACFFCLHGQPTLCERGMDHAFAGPYGAIGSEPVLAALGTATFAEETILPAAAAIPLDEDFPLELAALVGCGVVTGVGAVIHAAKVSPGDTVAIVGCGGVGLSAVQGARAAGASRIIAVDRVASKLAMATENGATDVVDASTLDAASAVRELTHGRGADHAIEVVGTSQTIAQAYAMARRGGTVTIVGAGRFDDEVCFGAMNLMVDAKRVQGCVYGGADPSRDFPRVVAMARAGQLDLERLVTRRLSLGEVNEGFRAMAAGEVARSVLVL